MLSSTWAAVAAGKRFFSIIPLALLCPRYAVNLMPSPLFGGLMRRKPAFTHGIAALALFAFVLMGCQDSLTND
jgi:hypothetical protein